jgi:hypothetical protein
VTARKETPPSSGLDDGSEDEDDNSEDVVENQEEEDEDDIEDEDDEAGEILTSLRQLCTLAVHTCKCCSAYGWNELCASCCTRGFTHHVAVQRSFPYTDE